MGQDSLTVIVCAVVGLLLLATVLAFTFSHPSPTLPTHTRHAQSTVELVPVHTQSSVQRAIQRIRDAQNELIDYTRRYRWVWMVENSISFAQNIRPSIVSLPALAALRSTTQTRDFNPPLPNDQGHHASPLSTRYIGFSRWTRRAAYIVRPIHFGRTQIAVPVLGATTEENTRQSLPPSPSQLNFPSTLGNVVLPPAPVAAPPRLRSPETSC